MLRQLFGRLSKPTSPRRSSPKLNILNLEDRSVPAAFTAGNLVIHSVATAGAGGSNQVSVIEYSPAGTPVQTITMPNASSRPTAAPYNLTDVANSTAVGFLSRSADGSYLVIPGYNGISTDTNLASSNAATVSRVVGVIDAAGNIDTSRAGTWNSGGAFRSAASTNSTDFWVAGSNGFSHVNGSTATAFGSTNARVANVFNGQLYISSASTAFNGSGSNLGIWAIGTGTPTSGTPTLTNVINTQTGSSPYDFVFSADGNTAYVADDRASAAGGIQKWTNSGGTWSLAYTLGTGVVNIGARGIAVNFSGTNPIIYATSGETSANRLFTITDTGASSTATTLAAAASGSIFRGVDFAPVAGSSNSAPTLAGANNLASIAEDPTTNNGSTVASLIAGQITDSDSGALKGIAITGTVTTNGTWEYTTNGGTSWTNVGTVSDSAALLLTDSANTSVRFVPNQDYNGVVTNGLTFRAWDQTSGTAGTTASTTTNGGTSAFSTATASASITVTAVNDKPVNTVPGMQLVGTGTTFNFSAANVVSIADVDAGMNPVQVSLSVDGGTLTLSGTMGLTFSAGANGTGSMTFTGTIPDINSALNGLLFAAPSTPGLVTFTIVTNDQDSTPETDTDTVLFTIAEINDAPQGTDKTATLFVDTAYTLTTADFGFSDPNDTLANALFAVKIATLPTHGTLTLDGGTVNVNDFISVADITANKLVYTPALAGVGFPYSSFTFQVQDDGLTMNGGQDTDQSPNTLTFNVRTANQAPQGTDATIVLLEDSTYTLTVADFGFSDPNGLPTNAFASVVFFTVPGTGQFRNDGLTITSGQEIAVADIIAGKMTFKPSLNMTGNFASFMFQVRDDGDTINGGVNLDPTPNVLTFDVTAVADAPSGADATVSTNQDVPYVFGAADFTVADVIDNPAPQGLAGLTVVTLPTLGTLTVNNVAVTVGQFITLANLVNGEFVYTPVTGGSGSPYSSFTFQVRDLGSTANGGLVDDPTPNTLTIDVIVPNVAPVLSLIYPDLSPVARNTVGGAGQTVASFIGSTIADGDVGALQGIAVVVANTPPAEGVWQFSIDAGTTWASLAAASMNAAVLLRSTDLVRFVPATGFLGEVYLTYHAWDQFAGSAGGTANLTGNTGGSSSFSVDSDVASLDVALPLPNVPEDSRAPVSSKASTLTTNLFIDPDLKAKKGVAVVGMTGTEFGTWQYFAGRWKPMVIPQGSALLLSDASNIRFLPSANVTGTATFTYHAWDQTTGRSGTLDSKFAMNPTGGGSAYSADSLVAMLNVTPVNDAPVLDITGNPPFTSVTPGNNNPAGDLVGNIIGTMVTDLEGDAIQMAVIGTTGSGTWQFKRGAADWQNFRSIPRISSKDPVFLELTDLVRFVPAPNFSGSAKLTYKAFDGLSFSRATETGSVLVSPFIAGPANVAPVLGTAPTPTIPAANEDSKPAGSTVAALLGTAFTDANIGSKRGIAITGFTGAANGSWQYSVNGGKAWKAIVSASDAYALLLRETDKVRFLPNKDFFGTATITYHAWDQSRGGVGQRADLTVTNGTGGNSPFSTAEETATATINAVNDAPVLDTKPNPFFTSILPADADPAGNTVQSIVGTAGTDVDGDTIRMAIIGKTGTGLWQFQLDGQSNWTTINTVSLAAPQLLNLADKIRYVPSGFVGVAKLTLKLSDGTLLSQATETASIVVNEVDDRPVLNAAIKPVLNPVLKDNTDPTGTAVASLLAGAVTDADANAQLGMAVTFADEKNGLWQFSTDNGTTWQEIDNGSVKTPVLIASNALLRFKPNTGFIGIARISYKAWDSASTAANGPLALSAAITTATVSVNTAPSLV